MNAKIQAEIDCLIRQSFWPAVKRGLEGTDLYAGEEALESIRTNEVSSFGSSRELTFIIHDPFQPIGSKTRPAWFCRGTLECSLESYMLSFDFRVELPMTFNLWRIIELIGNRLFAGNPPTLCVEHDREGQKSFLVSFHTGRGADFGAGGPGNAAASIEKRVRDNVAIIDCVDILFEDLESTELFLDLRTALLAEYASK